MNSDAKKKTAIEQRADVLETELDRKFRIIQKEAVEDKKHDKNKTKRIQILKKLKPNGE